MHLEVGVNLAGVDAPVLQVRQVALQRRRQQSVQLRLFGRGLKRCSVCEVEGSHWPDRLTAADRAHPRHGPGRFGDRHHIVFAFGDSTLDVLCERVDFEVLSGPVHGLVPRMRAYLGE